MITTSFDTYKMIGGWKSPMNIHRYPTPIKVNKTNTKFDEAFNKIEAEWLTKRDPEVFKALIESKREDDEYIAANETSFINDLTELCVREASKIWGGGTNNLRHKRSKKKGLVIGKLAWIRRAKKACTEIEVLNANNKIENNRRKKLMKRLKNDKWEDLPSLTGWDNINRNQKEKWVKRLEGLYASLSKELKRLETKEKWSAHEKTHTFMVEDGAINSSKYRKWKLKVSSDPDGEAIKAADGSILVGEQQIRNRYAEYYGGLLKGEATRVKPPDPTDRQTWMDADTIRENRRKLEEVTKGKSIVAEPPTIEEYLEAVNKGDPMSSGGKDGIQYGVLQKLSMSTHMAINGMLTHTNQIEAPSREKERGGGKTEQSGQTSFNKGGN